MASEIRVDKINSLSGVGTVTLSPTGVDIAGITTAATLRATTGIVTSLTAVSSAKVGSGVTLSPDGDIFATGVCTATSFVGSGANLTGITGTTINNNTDNYVITGTGTANTLNGEENLTWDGTILTVDKGSDNGAVLQCRNDDDTAYSSAAEGHLNSVLSLQSTTPGGQNDQSVGIQFNLGLTGQTGSIQEIGAVRTGNGEGALIFRTRNSSAGRIERFRIASDGNVSIVDGNLSFASGHGIDFSATANSGNSASTANELFDDYEEGTWVPTSRDGTLSYNYANYTKIGRMVHVTAYLDTFSDNSTNDQVTIQGLPFSQSVGDVAVGSVMYGNVSDGNKTVVYLHNSRNGFTFYGGETGGYDNVRYNELSGSSSFYMQATYFAS